MLDCVCVAPEGRVTEDEAVAVVATMATAEKVDTERVIVAGETVEDTIAIATEGTIETEEEATEQQCSVSSFQHKAAMKECWIGK